MATPFESFKRILFQIPKLDTKDTFTAQEVYNYYFEKESRLDVEAFFGMQMDSLLTRHVYHQDTYDTLYREYKELAKRLQQVFNAQHPS